MLRNWFRHHSSQTQPPNFSVLIVGDDHAALSMMGDTLKEKQYHVQATSNIAETLQLLEEAAPDVLICDFDDPQTQGKRFLEKARIRLGKSAMPAIVFLRDTQEDEIVANAVGADELIFKPFDARIFLERIERLMMKKTENQNAKARK